MRTFCEKCMKEPYFCKENDFLPEPYQTGIINWGSDNEGYCTICKTFYTKCKRCDYIIEFDNSINAWSPVYGDGRYCIKCSNLMIKNIELGLD